MTLIGEAKEKKNSVSLLPRATTFPFIINYTSHILFYSVEPAAECNWYYKAFRFINNNILSTELYFLSFYVELVILPEVIILLTVGDSGGGWEGGRQQKIFSSDKWVLFRVKIYSENTQIRGPHELFRLITLNTRRRWNRCGQEEAKEVASWYKRISNVSLFEYLMCKIVRQLRQNDDCDNHFEHWIGFNSMLICMLPFNASVWGIRSFNEGECNGFELDCSAGNEWNSAVFLFHW